MDGRLDCLTSDIAAIDNVTTATAVEIDWENAIENYIGTIHSTEATTAAHNHTHIASTIDTVDDYITATSAYGNATYSRTIEPSQTCLYSNVGSYSYGVWKIIVDEPPKIDAAALLQLLQEENLTT